MPVRSSFQIPSRRTRARRSRYCFISRKLPYKPPSVNSLFVVARRKVNKFVSWSLPLVRALLEFLYLSCRETGYSAKWPCGISGADPGAVPGASTRLRAAWISSRPLWGRIRIDARGKGLACARYGTAVIGPWLYMPMITLRAKPASLLN